MSPEEYMRDQLAKQPAQFLSGAACHNGNARTIGGSALTPMERVTTTTVKLPSISDTLAERGGRYGKFIDHSKISQALQDAMRAAENWDKLDVDMRQALTTIADKMARILNGDPYYADSWHDVSGYATLVERRLLELEKAK